MDQPSSCPRASTRQRIKRLVPALPLLLAAGGCGLIRAPAPGLTPPMPVQAPLRKQVLQDYMPLGSIGWVGNDKVVFHGLPVGQMTGKQSLYLWDMQGKARQLLPSSRNSCIRGEIIRTAQFIGKGEPKLLELRAPDFRPRPRVSSSAPSLSVFDPVSCSWIASPPSLRGHKWLALQRGEGFLDFTPNDRQIGPFWAVEHLDGEARTRRDTGIRMPKPMLPTAVHAAHDNSYLVFDLNVSQAGLGEWRDNGRRRIWKLNAQMRGIPMNVPYGAWSDQDVNFQQARPGLLIISNNFDQDRAAGGAGLYLLRPGFPAQRLERGLVEKATVSPDGCRIAYGFRPRLDTGIPEGGPRLVVLDLCDAIPPATR